MGYLPDYKHDVFISYSHSDNEVDRGQAQESGWVSRLAALFERELISALGSRLVNVSFDYRRPASTITEYMERIQGSALLLVIGSRTYVEEGRTALKEYRAFREVTQDNKRLFMIERKSFSHAVLGSEVDGDIVYKALFSSDEGTDIEFAPDTELFKNGVKKMAERVRERLEEMKGKVRPSTTVREKSRQASKTVLLTHVTEDLLLDREELLTFLSSEVEVKPASSFPADGRSFETAYRNALAQSEMVVQLLSASPGVAYPGMSVSYAQFQYEEAVKAGKEIIQWRAPTLNLQTVGASDQRRMLQGSHVQVMGFEEFKKTVRMRATQKVELPPERLPGSVFVNAEGSDARYARMFSDAFSQANMAVTFADETSDETVPTEQQRKQLTLKLTQSDIIVYVVKDAPLTWITGQIIKFPEFAKQRSTPPKQTAICVESPAVRDRIRAALPADANPRDYFVGDWQPARIQSLVRELLA